MRRFAGCCRFTYNRALELQQARHSCGETRLGYTQLCREITAWRNAEDTAWLAQAPVHPLQQAMKDLKRAYENFFAGRARFPRFRKRGRRDSFRYPDPKTDKARRRQQPPVPAQARLATLPQQPHRARSNQKRHSEPKMQPVVCLNPDRTRGVRTGTPRHCSRRRRRDNPLRNALRRHRVRTSPQLQAAPRTPAPCANKPEPKNETQLQLAQSQSARTAHLRSYRQRPPRLPAQMLDHRQPESRDGVHRGSGACATWSRRQRGRSRIQGRT